MKLKSQFTTVITETVWNYEYETKEEFKIHKEEMLSKGIYIDTWHQCKNGKFIAAYVKREEKQV